MVSKIQLFPSGLSVLWYPLSFPFKFSSNFSILYFLYIHTLNFGHKYLIEAQLLSNQGVTHRQKMKRSGLWTISQLFVDLFGRFIRFCHLELTTEVIYDG